MRTKGFPGVAGYDQLPAWRLVRDKWPALVEQCAEWGKEGENNPRHKKFKITIADFTTWRGANGPDGDVVPWATNCVLGARPASLPKSTWANGTNRETAVEDNDVDVFL